MWLFENFILIITSTYFHHYSPFSFLGAWLGIKERVDKELDILKKT